MTTTAQDPSDEWGRLAAVSSLAEVVARHVDDFAPVQPGDFPEWLTTLGVPAGWRLAHLDGDGVQPSRIAVCNLPPERGGGLGCETISLFGFTGVAPLDAVRDDADRTLRELNADGINTRVLAAPPGAGVAAVRSSGYFDVAELRIWAQYSTYLRGSNGPNQGRLIQHSLFVEASSLHLVRNGVVQLSDAVHHAFLAMQ